MIDSVKNLYVIGDAGRSIPKYTLDYFLEIGIGFIYLQLSDFLNEPNKYEHDIKIFHYRDILKSKDFDNLNLESSLVLIRRPDWIYEIMTLVHMKNTLFLFENSSLSQYIIQIESLINIISGCFIDDAELRSLREAAALKIMSRFDLPKC